PTSRPFLDLPWTSSAGGFPKLNFRSGPRISATVPPHPRSPLRLVLLAGADFWNRSTRPSSFPVTVFSFQGNRWKKNLRRHVLDYSILETAFHLDGGGKALASNRW